MHKYIFNASDIAAYFKWFSVPSYLEVSYMQYIFSIGKPVLAAPLTADFENFKKEVYRELYYLWACGFENERSDISNMHDGSSFAVICDQECINLESYMKLIALHLIFTKNLPYVKINFTGLPLAIGLECDYSIYEENVYKAVTGLDLECTDMFGRPFDLRNGIPDELLRLSLTSRFKQEVIAGRDFRESLKKNQDEKMSELKEKSLKIFGTIPIGKRQRRPASSRRRSPSSDRSRGEIANSKSTSSAQPKGIPLEERRHKEGNK